MATGKHKDIWYETGIPRQEAELHECLEAGFPYQVYNNLADISGLSKKEVAEAAAIAPATLARRSKTKRFNRDESDRLYRVARVMDAATDFFGGDREAAMDWLTHPVLGLGDRRPVDMLKTSAEADSVVVLIERLKHGIIV
ncbi:MAG: DUF2384 domain-containing protein [Candidatus Dadabacteria bacterium]|nr:DUF2384 domain-containing protein [Candidatus Dadabacteria bacterium]